MELRPLVFYDVFVFQSSLLLIYTSGALNDTKFCLCVICFLFRVDSSSNYLPVQSEFIYILFKNSFPASRQNYCFSIP